MWFYPTIGWKTKPQLGVRLPYDQKFFSKGLNDQFDVEFALHPGLNIRTGKNGAGKTTVLKLIYYIISGN